MSKIKILKLLILFNLSKSSSNTSSYGSGGLDSHKIGEFTCSSIYSEENSQELAEGDKNFLINQESKVFKRKFSDALDENISSKPDAEKKVLIDHSSLEDLNNVKKSQNWMNLLLVASQKIDSETDANIKNSEKQDFSDIEMKHQDDCRIQLDNLISNLLISKNIRNHNTFNNPNFNELNNSIVESHQSNGIRFRNTNEIEDLGIYSDISELIAKIIFFRKEIDQFLYFYFSTAQVNIQSDFRLNKLIEKNSEFDSSIFYLPNSNKIARSLMLLVHITLDFIKKNENYSELYKKYDLTSNRISKSRKRIEIFSQGLENKDLNDKKRFQLTKKLDEEIDHHSNLIFERESFPNRPSVSILLWYIQYIGMFGTSSKQFIHRWITFMYSVYRVSNFYDMKLKDNINIDLDKFKCPAFYSNREILTKENSFIDTNSMTFVILDWIFYFFSSEFQTQFQAQKNFTSKILAKMTALIFILLNEPESVNAILSNNQKYERWLLKIENNLDQHRLFDFPNDILSRFWNIINECDRNMKISKDNFRTKVLKNSRLTFLAETKEIVKKYLLSLYGLALYTYNLEFQGKSQ